ncbi:MAG: hypothetical protein ACK47B_21745 [Armatimonadota bacterium]
MKDFLIGLLGGRFGQALLKARDYVDDVTETDESLQALQPGETATVDLPDELDVKFKSRSGKRFSVDVVGVKRLK